MQSSGSVGMPREPRWRTYVKSALFIAPALLAWAFIAVFVFPKLQQMWVDSKMMDSEFQWMMSSLQVAMMNTKLICALPIILFVVLEFTGDWWPRYRRAVVGAFVFVFNTTIVIGLTGACLVAAIAGPALMHR
jgi:hypothetical protein